jgi:hypothetical protein
MHILAGHEGQPPGFAAMEITVPARFAGPIPHAHDEFDEAIYVLSGRLLVTGDGEPARVLGLWAPPAPALAFMRDIGAALRPDTTPEPDHMREIYERHASRLLP